MSRGSLIKVRRSDGSIDTAALASVLNVTEAKLVELLGLSDGSAVRKFVLSSPEAERRLIELVEILERLIPWCGEVGHAYNWYRHQPLEGFGGQTAQELVRCGRTSAIHAYLERVAAGGYA